MRKLSGASGLLTYEKESNPLLVALKNDFADLMKKLTSLKNTNVAIFAPLSGCFEKKFIDKSFVYTHVVFTDKVQWTSLNGLRGQIGEKSEFLQLFTSEPIGDVLEPPKPSSWKVTGVSIGKIQILRTGDVIINGKNIPLFLIAEPVKYKDCPWKSTIIDKKIDELVEMQKPENSSPCLFKKTFSFQDFVEKMKHKSTLGLVKKIKLFIDQISESEYKDTTCISINKFIREMEETIVGHPHWKGASDLEIENAREGIEKYIMTKLYGKVFSPAIEDVEIDTLLSNRLGKFQNVIKPENLDIPIPIENDPKWNLAVEELRKINQYKTPRDKLICISNCCKSIFSVIQKGSKGASADEFLPCLVFLICKSNVSHLHSNVKYILDYRNPDQLMTEMGYHLTNIQSAIMFWQNVIPRELNLTQEEFDKILEIQSVIKIEESDENIQLDVLPHEFYGIVDQCNVERYDFQLREFQDMTFKDLRQVYEDYKKLLDFYDNMKVIAKHKPVDEVKSQDVVETDNQTIKPEPIAESIVITEGK